MDSLIDRLQHQADELDPTGLDPAQHLASVVRRGRRYRAVTSTLGVLGATAVLAGGAVAAPQVVRLLQGPSQPIVASSPDGEQVPTPDGASEDPTEPPAATLPPVVEESTPAPESVVIDAVPPALDVLEPADGAEVTSAEVTFSGTTEPGARVAVGDYEATVDGDGRWSILLIAAEGTNTVTFEATDATGNTAVRTTSVTYRPPAKAMTTTPSPAKDDGATVTKEQTQQQTGVDDTLTASQQSDVLSAAPHKNIYAGTAAPGAKVAVVSAYGAGYVWADDAGRWEVLVDFDPPGGETTFPVTVKLYHRPEVARTFQLTTVAAAVAAFTASQELGAVPVGSPTNTYGGSGEPGHEVLVWTELHGQTTTVIGADGTWQVALTYTDITAGDAFAVKALDLDTGTKQFFEVTVIE